MLRQEEIAMSSPMTTDRTTLPETKEMRDALDEAGLLIRVDGPINKDTELHPLVRWQFRGGMKEEDRKAWLFTNIVDSKGKKYDMPVLVEPFELLGPLST